MEKFVSIVKVLEMPRPAGEFRSIKINDGGFLDYEVIGEGPPLVMLHGFLANRSTFSRQLQSFAEHYQLILLNLRGCAGSNYAVPSNYGLTTSDLEDLSAILDAENIESANLFAHSSGGATAFALARNVPSRVDRIVLVEPTLIQLMPSAEYEKIASEHNNLAAVGETNGAAEGLRAVVAKGGGDAWAQLDKRKQDAALHSMAGCAPFVGPHLRSINETVVTEEDVKNLQAHSLLFYGDRSYWWQKFIAGRFRELRPDITLKTIKNAGHNVHRDQADIVNAETLGFLSK